MVVVLITCSSYPQGFSFGDLAQAAVILVKAH